MNICQDCGKSGIVTKVIVKTVNAQGDHLHNFIDLCVNCKTEAEDTDTILMNEEDLEEWTNSHELDDILDDSDSSYLVGC